MTCGQIPAGGCGNPDRGHDAPCTSAEQIESGIGVCETCGIPIRVLWNTETRLLVAVYAVCTCSRPTIDEANQAIQEKREGGGSE